MPTPVILNRITPPPIQSEQFSSDFNSWLSVVVDELNEVLSRIESALNA